MNVLEVYPVFLPRKGGVQTYIADLCRCMISRGHYPIVLASIPSKPSLEFIDGIEVRRVKIPLLLRVSRYPLMLCLFFYIIYMITKYDIDLIHAHDYLPGLASAIPGGLLHKPVVVTFHLPISNTTWVPAYVSPIELLLKRCFMCFVSAIICVSRYTYNDTAKLGFSRSRMKLIYNWITTSPMHKTKADVREEFDLNQKRFILCVGRLEDKQKNISAVIKALQLLVSKGYDLHLVIVGEGPDKKAYSKYALRLGVKNRVYLLGSVSDAYLKHLYELCELFVLPSRLEALSIVLLEAMSFGKPVVATRVGGNAEVIENGCDGILVDPDPPSLSSGIEKLLLNPHLKDMFAKKALKVIRTKFSRQNCLSTAILLEAVFQSHRMAEKKISTQHSSKSQAEPMKVTSKEYFEYIKKAYTKIDKDKYYDRYMIVNLQNARFIMDVGCGVGFLLQKLYSNYPQSMLIGIDINRHALDYARKVAPAAHLIRGAAHRLPFLSKEFDVIFALDLIEHLENPSGFLKEILRVLTNAGSLVLSTPDRYSLVLMEGKNIAHQIIFNVMRVAGFAKIDPTHINEFSMPELSKFLALNRFEIIRCNGYKTRFVPFHKMESMIVCCKRSEFQTL